MTHTRTPPLRSAAPRRGVLLLVVLSMLTLFLLLGAAFLVAAGRAREVARAHARLTFGGDEARTPYARLLDAVALNVIRGGFTPVATVPTGSPPGPAITFESLLADKYGPNTLTGTVSSVVVSGPVATAQLILGSNETPTNLNGRVLTFVEPGRPATSHRIIRARGAGSTNAPSTTFTVALDIPVRSGPFTQPAASSRVVINDREFAGGAPANEPWDGFDADNAFLAQVAPGSSMSTSVVSRLSYVGSPPTGFAPTWEYGPADSVPEATDNDGDGVPDGIFLDFGLPDAVDAAGNVTQVRASVLVVDLDSRFNVNAHGSLAPVLYAMNSSSGTHPGWPTNPTILTTGALEAVPMGSGYGPPEINANLGQGAAPKTPSAIASGVPRMFDTANLVITGTENPKVVLLTGASSGAGAEPRMLGERALGSRFTAQGANPNKTPRIRYTEGKYGEKAPTGWISGTGGSLSVAALSYARPGRADVADVAGITSVTRVAPNQSPTMNYGVPAMWWNATNTFDAGSPGAVYPLPRGVYNSPPDLHGRMKTLTLAASAADPSAMSPQLVFVQPEWSTTGIPCEIKDNPYELQLDTRAGFGGWIKDPTTRGNTLGTLADNPFTPAELEPVLRPYDIDTNRCQPRLAALLGSAAEDSRLKITTDSWDTTAIVGDAVTQLTAWLQNGTAGTLYGTDAVTGMIGGEVARGERFDLNRPLAAFETANAGYSATADYYVQRQAYFKDLYTLLVALEQGAGAAPPPARAAELAQWAANVVEFRDADSRVTPFEYDTDPRDGWSLDGDVATADGGGQRAVVWGTERPEVLIRETLAWDGGSDGGLIVSLHRPWNSMALSKTSSIAGEPCDYAFDTLCSKTNVTVPTGVSGIPGNIVDLGKKAGPSVLIRGSNPDYNVVTAATYPIWRLRLVAGGTSFIRFDTAATAVGNGEFAPAALASGADKPKLPVDTTLTIYPGPLTGTATFKWTKTDGTTVTGSITISGSACQMAPTLRVPSGQTTAVIYLERLSDPSQVPTAAQWAADPLANLDTTTDTLRYVVVDSGTFNVISTGGNPAITSTSGTSQRRSTSNPNARFWKNDFVDGTVISPTNLTATLPTTIPANDRASVSWLPWLNRPFVSGAELFLVPKSSAAALLSGYQEFPQQITAATVSNLTIPLSPALTAARLFNAVHVPTRFAGIHVSGTVDTFNDTGISNVTTPVNQFSSFREPGRVNLNTVTDTGAWNTVVGGPLPSVLMQMIASGTTGTTSTQDPYAKGTAVQDLAGLIARGAAGGGLVVTDSNPAPAAPGWDRNPLHRLYTATRLANTVTPRSHVFAVWVTLREMAPNDPDSVRYHRAFYIVDRSIPVGHESGRNHNVWDCVRVRRIIE